MTEKDVIKMASVIIYVGPRLIIIVLYQPPLNIISILILVNRILLKDDSNILERIFKDVVTQMFHFKVKILYFVIVFHQRFFLIFVD